MTTTTRPDGIDWVRRLAPAVPYVAMLVGLHGLSSGWIAILLYHAGIVAILTATGTRPRLRPARNVVCSRLLATLVVGAGLVGPVVYGLWSRIRLDGADLGGVLADVGLSGASWALFVVYYATVNPALEEVFWRHHLGSALRRPVWNDLWFAGYHVLVLVEFVEALWVAAAFVALAGAGWLWRQAARRCDGVLLPIVSHAVADASLILGAVFLVG